MPDNRPPSDGRGDGQPPVRFNPRSMVLIAFVLVGILVALWVSQSLLGDRKEIRADEFWLHVQKGEVKLIRIMDLSIEGELRDGDITGRSADDYVKFKLAYVYSVEPGFKDRLSKMAPNTIEVTHEPGDGTWGIVQSLLLWALILGMIWFFFIRQLRGGGGGAGFLGQFGRSRHRVTSKEHTHVTFGDVAGIEEAKEEVREIIEFLKNPKRFQRLGARIPRGVLLVGQPGCGKTLLAKAIAGEAEVPFFSISGSDFVEMFVGVGASRVRDLFKQAKDSSPCIIFLDEIDAVGRRRGAGFGGGGHDEREQTLNAILVEMDGFDSNDQVIVIAATNRLDVLDPALTRPGRFDRQITVPLPDIRGRMDILKIYAEKVSCGPDVDLKRLARGTPMFSGADLAALVNEAAIAATMANKDFVEQVDLEEARDKVRWGRARRSRVIDEQENRITAYHEAGHTVIQKLTPEADPLHKVSIIPRGPSGGATFSLPEKDRHIYTKKYCEAHVRVCLGGRLAEEMFCDDISSGASADIQQATSLARTMVLDWGMSEKLGFVRYAAEENNGGMLALGGRDYSDATSEVIDAEIRRIIDEATSVATELLGTHREHIEQVAEALLKYETLDAAEVGQIMDGKPLDRPNVLDILAAEKAKRDAEDEPGDADADERPADSDEPSESDPFGGPPPMPE